MLKRLIAALIAAHLGCVAAGAQAVPRYQIVNDTLAYEMDNPFRMYWVRGSDTIGVPQYEHSVESHLWSGAAAKPINAARQAQSKAASKRSRTGGQT